MPSSAAKKKSSLVLLQDNEDNQEADDDDDEKDRMLSMLKTAVGFFLVPLALFTLFGGGSDRQDG